MRLGIVAVAMALLATPSWGANSLRVVPDSANIDDTVTIIVTLEGSFAKLDGIEPPVRNLRIDGPPSVSSQFQLINGRMSRWKTLRWAALPVSGGTATVGPLTLTDEDGRVDTLAQVTLQVSGEEAARSTDPEVVSREIEAASRDKVFLLPEASATSVVTGEQVIVTWYLYAAQTVQDLRISAKPKLDDFWTEEIPVDNESWRTVILGGRTWRRIPVRRVAVFPLSAGVRKIGGFEAIAEIVEPMRDPVEGFFSFSGRMTRIRRRAPEVSIEVKPLPEGRFDGVGSFGLRCSPAVVPEVGPVSLIVKVRGSGNLRSARAPRFSTVVDATVQTEDVGTTVDRTGQSVTMERSWKLLLFPKKSGSMVIPSLVFDTFDPAMGSIRNIECGGSTVLVRAFSAGRPAPRVSIPATRPEEGDSVSRMILLVSVWILLLLTITAGTYFALRQRRKLRVCQELVSGLLLDAEPGGLRRRIAVYLETKGISVADLTTEGSDRGDAYRSILSWLEIRQKERFTSADVPGELERRVATFVVEIEKGELEK